MFTFDTEDSNPTATGLPDLVTNQVFHVGLELHKAFGLISQNRNSGAQQHIRLAVGKLDNLVSGVRRTHSTDHRMLGVLFGIISDLANGARSLDTLTRHCVELLPVDAAGVILAGEHGSATMATATATRPSARNLLPLLLDSAHANDWRAGNPQTTRLAAADHDPFATRAALEGITAVHTLPIRSDDHTCGALILLSAGDLTANNLTMARCLADLASIAIRIAEENPNGQFPFPQRRRTASSDRQDTLIG